MSREFDVWQEQADDYYAAQADEARLHALDLEQERADCDPHDFCDIHGAHIPLATGDCPACLDDDALRRDRIRNRFDHPAFPTRRQHDAA